MALASSIRRSAMIVFSSYFALVGGAEFFILFLSGFRHLPFGVLGVFSLITAYGLIKTKKWAAWLVVILFFLRITSGAITLYASIQSLDPTASVWLLHLMLITYLATTVVASLYIITKRESFQ